MLRQHLPTDHHDKEHSPTEETRQPFGSLLSLAAVALLSALLVLDALTHAQPLVLPILSAILTIIGFGWAAVAALQRRKPGVSLEEKEMGPAFVVFLGFAAAILSDADQLATYLQMK